MPRLRRLPWASCCVPAGAGAVRLRGGSGVDASGQGMLNPEHLCTMLSSVAGRPLTALHCHRLAIHTRDAQAEPKDGGPLSESEAAEAAESAYAALAAAQAAAAAAAEAAAAASADPELAAV